jgi:hypothetical protein
MELEIGRRGMADGDGGIGSVQELGNGTTNDVASAKNYGVLASNFNTGLLQQGNNTLRGARCEDGCTTTLGKLADVAGTKAVNILLVGDSGGDVGL